ncbi:MAG: hypothetical protein COU27_00565 [Candidatus Levybacteria bacterium CG10_big_fil_rev_8_21_14_0_10_36_7]|nr:MAG: hypothetical protein COU27_00565 [Candidatus Levybacteria bacterium CG10_big_fil_rev_8_21_14_0_10_36_7]
MERQEKGLIFIQKKSPSSIRRIRGFTLIELLVTVSIISILATFLMANFIGIRQRGRDAQRKSDVRQLQSALELWRSDNGIYPASIASCGSALTTGGVTYMQKIPCDPLGTGTYNGGNYYYPASDGLTYTIAACLENIKDPQGTSVSPGGSGCATSFYYVLQNP